MTGGLVTLGVIVLLVAISLGVRRYGESRRPKTQWQATDEVFRDPTTGRLMRVWTDPGDGSRHYVPDEGSGSAGRS